MHEIHDRRLVRGGRGQTRVLERGEGPAALVLLHGGLAGQSPYVGAAELWQPLLDRLRVPRVLALDTPGVGASTLSDFGELTLTGTKAWLAAMLAELGAERVVLVGHGEAALLALDCARERPEGIAVDGVALVAGHTTAPAVAEMRNLTLLSPPPRWSAASQRWALERLSYSAAHVTPELVARLAEHTADEPHRRAAELLGDVDTALERALDQGGAKAALYAHSRDVGFETPISIVWGAHDPLAPVEHGHGLFEVLSTTRAPLDFNVVTRCGHFPHRERPAEAARLIEPFALRCLRDG
ncbi:alpha/beta hydrolase [Conexibacter stalactiti]|uniref:Alpha/beta hydrolase n=1 Tax=Conexibacter stalactiti TaxID=1940611 RepID=A0ABU4HJG1_9ACTN|nr:alpha/beta hydrolase [Conexibacter stalactiti]MDW5593451.1 alpha/beta hydrolase [Conexibacter stalactiti]MEC5034092.1 alpha/beta hydrolase [Conexibacter stalactiti]